LNANVTTSEGARTFPTPGLSVRQISEAIKENDLSPIIIEGFNKTKFDDHAGFTKLVFNNYLGTLVRSGYPILLSGLCLKMNDETGELEEKGRHAIVCIGIRSAYLPPVKAKEYGFNEHNVSDIYIHDDNFGPNVRFVIEINSEIKFSKKKGFCLKKGSVEEDEGIVLIKPFAPDMEKYGIQNGKDPLKDQLIFLPTEMMIAINKDIFVSPQDLFSLGIRIAEELSEILNDACKLAAIEPLGIHLSFRYINSLVYLNKELEEFYDEGDPILSRTRLEIKENEKILSNHIGLIRLGINAITVLDIIVDTSNVDKAEQIWGVVSYNKEATKLFLDLKKQLSLYNISCGSPLIESYDKS